MNPNLEPKPSPLPPEGGSGEGLRFSDFEAVWPFSAVESRAKAKRAFEALADEDRREAVKWAKRFIEIHAERRRKHCDAKTYLDERRFDEFRPKPDKAALATVVVWPGTQQAAAWDHYKREVERVRHGLLFLSEKRHPETGKMTKCAVLRSEWPPPTKAAGSDAA